jgi:hypothetical protein
LHFSRSTAVYLGHVRDVQGRTEYQKKGFLSDVREEGERWLKQYFDIKLSAIEPEDVAEKGDDVLFVLLVG